MVIYVCYTPRSLARPCDLAKKVKCLREKRTTTHWPHRPIMSSVRPHTYGNPYPDVGELPDPVLTSLGRRLAGL